MNITHKAVIRHYDYSGLKGRIYITSNLKVDEVDLSHLTWVEIKPITSYLALEEVKK